MIERAQKTVEQHHYSTRKRLLQYDDVASKHREVVYTLRQESIQTDDPRELIFELIEEEIEDKLDEYGLRGSSADEDSRKGFLTWAVQTFPIRLTEEDVAEPGEALKSKVLEEIRNAYKVKEAAEDPEALQRLERMVLISTIDRHYQTHLTEMEDLRQSVGLRSYGQKDPLVEYKNEAFSYFNEMMNQVRADICSGIFRSVTNMQSFEQMMQHLRRRATTSGPSDPDGESPARAPRPVSAARPAGASLPAGLPPAGGAPGIPAARGNVKLPQVKRRPVTHAHEPRRNETVRIRRGEETQEMKWKKAERMVKEEGWELVQPKK